jgi:3-oxoacyl-[acyl-carrier-protein] synthase-3
MKKPDPLVEVVATGRFLPERVVTNHDLARRLDTSDEWIRTRTGIRERRIAPDGVTTAHLGAGAARNAMTKAGVEPGEVDIIVLCTSTPDHWMPATACETQALLGCSNAWAFDVMAACSGFLYAMSVAEGYLAAGRGEIALVVAAEKMSSIVNWNDRSTCVLFGDGAGAAVLRRADGSGRGIVATHLRSDGRLSDLLCRPAGGAAEPITQGVIEQARHLVRMEGREVFKNAVRSMAEACDFALQHAGLTAGDIDLLVPHQANVRIIEATAKYANIPMERVFVNVDRYGNMSAASVPVGLDEAAERGLIGAGAHVMTVAFGAGLTWGAMVIRF